jgi:DNA polymerase (family X)
VHALARDASPLMLALAHSLSLMAAIAAMRGRHAEAADFSRVAARLASGGGDPADTDTATVREALARIRDLGPASAIDEAVAEVPQDLRLLAAGGHLEIADVAELHRVTGATSLGELHDRLSSPPLVGSVDATLLERARAGIAQVSATRPRIPLGRAWSLLDPVLTAIRDVSPEVERIVATGSFRRFAAVTGDLEVLVASADATRTIARLLALPFISSVLYAGHDKVVVRFDRAELTIHVVNPDSFVPRLVSLTGSAAHVSQVRQRAASLGLTLTRDALIDHQGRAPTFASEDDLYAALDLAPVPPELREGAGEVEAAARRELPGLLCHEQIRGDLHMHTDWSDGRDPLEGMLLAAEALGYEYVAITDHSQTSAIARGLDVDRLERQIEAVAAAREKHPAMAILQGSEVDILPDGSLDFPDAVLERLDVVLASLHDMAGHSGAQLTDRYIQAMHSPFVHIVTHPTNRLVPNREGYTLDEPRLFDAAVQTGTILEIDGAPGHLDMDGAMARRAITAGALVSVDGDCHRADLLGRHMLFAVGTARRGWVEARHVVNALPLEGLRARFTAKRQAS